MGVVGLIDGCMTCIRYNRIYGRGYNRSPHGALFPIIFIHIENSGEYGRMDEQLYLRTVFYVERDVKHNVHAILKYIYVGMIMESLSINKLHS